MMNKFLALLFTLWAMPSSGQDINLLKDKNPGFESGKAKWTASGGSFTISTTSPYQGTNIASFDASGLSQTVKNTLVAVGAALETRACIAGLWYKADSIVTGDYTLYAEDSTSAALGTALSLSPTTGAWTFAYVSFICPAAATTIRLVLNAGVANPAAISIDEMWLGSPSRTVLAADPVEIVAQAHFATTQNCLWEVPDATSLGAFATDTDCPAITVDRSSPIVSINSADTDLPQLLFTSLPAGIYKVEVSLTARESGSSANCNFGIYDGSAIIGQNSMTGVASTLRAPLSMSGTFSHTGGTKTISIRAGESVADTCFLSSEQNFAGAQGGEALSFIVTRLPTSSTGKVTLDTQGWFVDVSIGGAVAELGTSAVAAYAEAVSASWDLVNNGTEVAQIPCSTTNPPTGLTCAAGNESAGVSFIPPYTGWFLACADFTWYADVGLNDKVFAAFQLIETPTTAQTLTQLGKGIVQAGVEGSVDNSNYLFPVHVCGVFNFTTTTRKVIRLMYEQSITSTPDDSELEIDRNASNGQRDLHISVVPLTQNFPQAVALTGTAQVGVNSGWQSRIFTLNCDGGSAVLNDPASAVASIGNISGGVCIVTLNSGIFTATPQCMASNHDGGLSTGLILGVQATTTTNILLDCEDDAGGACTAHNDVVKCEGI